MHKALSRLFFNLETSLFQIIENAMQLDKITEESATSFNVGRNRHQHALYAFLIMLEI